MRILGVDMMNGDGFSPSCPALLPLLVAFAWEEGWSGGEEKKEEKERK